MVVATDFDQLRRWLGGNRTGATERGLNRPVVVFLTGGVGGFPGRCGAETGGAVSALAKWARPLVEAARVLYRMCRGLPVFDFRLGRLPNPLAGEQ